MKRINKYLYGWKLYVYYGNSWEYETFEETRAGYKENRKAYAENCTYPQRWTRGRETNPAYIEPINGIQIPVDFPVRPLKPGDIATDKMTCGTCGLSWDDAIPTTWTPVPSARCPFEYFHAEVTK